MILSFKKDGVRLTKKEIAWDVILKNLLRSLKATIVKLGTKNYKKIDSILKKIDQGEDSEEVELKEKKKSRDQCETKKAKKSSGDNEDKEKHPKKRKTTY